MIQATPHSNSTYAAGNSPPPPNANASSPENEHRDQLPLHFYNADSIAEGLGDANDPQQQAEARAIVGAAIETRFRSHEPFGFESTWSGSSRPAMVRRAHAQGYETHAVFLGSGDARCAPTTAWTALAGGACGQRRVFSLTSRYGPATLML